MSLRITVLLLLGLSSLGAAAQGPRPTPNTAAVRAGDFIVAVVNSEPITNQQVSAEAERIRRDLLAQRQTVPTDPELRRLVLERMINERAQLQLAQQMGIKVDDPSIDQAEQMVASQNRLTVEQLRRKAAQDGMDAQQLRDQLRDQLMLTRLREREVEPRVRVSDADVEQYLSEQQERATDQTSQLLNMAQLLVAVPEGAPEQEVQRLQLKAQRALERARSGEDFATLVRELSDASDRANGGEIGLRAASRYPSLFVEAAALLKPGELAGPLRSGAGFHVLKLLERRQAGAPPATVTQSRARHILLVPGTQMSEAQARDKLNDFRRRIQNGQSDFPSLARQFSQDGSAARGGDLGWANPGQFVPEFEQVMNQLAPGQISQPLISRFGVHLIQLIERRTAALSPQEQRELVRNMLREKKQREVYVNWMQEVRARAYVELRDAPQ